MRPLLLVLGLLVACETPRQTHRGEPVDLDDLDKPLERAYTPATVKFTCSEARAYDVALRQLTLAGFEVSFADPVARVIRSQRTIRDNITTSRMERQRTRIWNGLDYGARRIVMQRGDDEARRLAHGGAVWTRTMYLALAIDGHATIRPTVKMCEDFDGRTRCGTELDTLRPSEADLVREVGEAILAEQPPELERPVGPGVQQM